MRIIFIGQLGITQSRVQALAAKLVAAGHTVAVTCTAPVVSRRLRNFKGVALLHYPSFDPTKPGGLLYNLLNLLSVWRRQPDVAHLHGYIAAALLWLAVLFSPRTNFVVTLDNLPRRAPRLSRLVLRQAQAIADAITVPTQTLHYQLRTQFGINTAYIPDGYDPLTPPEINLRHFEVRKGQYCLTIPASLNELRWLIREYSRLATKKPLVALFEATPETQRLQKRHPLLYLASPKSLRTLETLTRHAAVVIAGKNPPPTSLLTAMASQRAIVAMPTSLNQETLGATAQFFTNGLTFRTLLQPLTKSRLNQSTWGRLAAHRARTHLTWERILPEYRALYQPAVTTPVQLDSVVATLPSEVQPV